MKKSILWGVALIVVFLAVGLWVRSSPPWIDRAVADTVGTSYENDKTILALTNIFGPTMPIVVGVAIAALTIVAWLRDRSWEAGVLLRSLIVLLACRAVSLFKDVFVRARPRVYPDYAYPSGHTVSVASVAFTGVVLCAWFARRALPWVIGLAVLLTAVAAACRVLLEVHWLTDVIGGAIGVTGVGLVAAAVLRLLPPRRA